jgi:hypothetical protein
MKKEIRKLLLLGVMLTGIVSSCQKDKSTFPDPATLPKGLIGSWVEVNTLADTVVFNSDNVHGTLWLQRGYEIRNGYRLPKIGSTGYEYTISSDSISMIDALSCSMQGGTYYFMMDETNMIINTGKFSEYIETEKSILTFRKIK